jgi:hypothetical protein
MSFEDNPWEPIPNSTCPQCGSVLVELEWFDDDPANGGACIGYQVTCTNSTCDHWENM